MTLLIHRSGFRWPKKKKIRVLHWGNKNNKKKKKKNSFSFQVQQPHLQLRFFNLLAAVALEHLLGSQIQNGSYSLLILSIFYFGIFFELKSSWKLSAFIHLLIYLNSKDWCICLEFRFHFAQAVLYIFDFTGGSLEFEPNLFFFCMR